MKAVTIAEMRAIDERAQTDFNLSVSDLMDAAGEAVATCYQEIHGSVPTLVFCGKGNNAGDGFVAARYLNSRSVPVQVLAMEPTESYSGAAREALDALLQTDVQIHPKDAARGLIAETPVVIDALLGTGINGPARNGYARMIHRINESECPVLSVDVPSGLRELQAGEQSGPTINADATVTIGLAKSLLLNMPGNDCAGRIIVEPINFPPELLRSHDIQLNYESETTLAEWIPGRPLDSNKGTFGNVGIIAGSAAYAGAALLVARAALRSGCGLASIYAPFQRHQ